MLTYAYDTICSDLDMHYNECHTKQESAFRSLTAFRLTDFYFFEKVSAESSFKKKVGS